MGKKWNKDAGSGEKLLRMFVQLLFIPKRYSIADLSRRLKCSAQTVKRNIDQLESVGWCKIVQEKEGRKTVFWMERPNRLPQVSLNSEGLETLILCHNFLQHLLPDPMRRNAESTLQQAFAYIPEDDTPLAAMASGISSGYAKGRIDYSQWEAALQTLRHSVKMQTVCEVSYRSASRTEPRTFSFAPMKLVSHHESLYIVGWEVTDKGRVTPVRQEPSPLLLQRFVAVLPTRCKKRGGNFVSWRVA